MGRHSSSRQLRYYRSIAGWFLPWMLAAAVAVTAVWFAVGALGQDAVRTAPPANASRPSAARERPSASPSPSVTPTPAAKETTARKPKDARERDVSLITDDVTVQVLNATSSADAGHVMADRLARLGFQIVAVGGASTAYARTTVMWSYESARPAASALARRFGWEVGPKPANLSPTVDLHVVVGADQA